MGTITSSREIDVLFQSAGRASHPLVIALVAQTPCDRDSEGRVAFIAGKRLGSAVARNRAKRVLRESARRLGAPWSGYDVVLLARADTGQVSPADLDSAVRTVLRRRGVRS